LILGLHALFYFVTLAVVFIMNNRELKLLIEPAIENIGYELTDLELKWDGSSNLLRLFIDRPEGITLDDCQAVSEQVGLLLDIDEPIQDDYVLEVSSPGLDRTLTKIEHYQRFIDEEIRVKLISPQDGRRNFKGHLIAVNDDAIEIKVDGEIFDLSIDSIEYTRLVPMHKK
jgi:ribosome maturation factor RimP